jgi:G:T-mismatch repair DNA endonuclease (very short patch repair protein)
MKHRKYWSDNEIEQLKNLYENMGLSISEITNIIDRDHISVRNKINKLKLKHTSEQTKHIKSNLMRGEKNPMYGTVGWKSGLTKYNSEIVRISGEKISKNKIEEYAKGNIKLLTGSLNPMFGIPAWCRGLTKETDEIINLRSKKASITLKNNWINLPEDKKAVIRQHCAFIGANCKKFKTSIEITIENFLISQNVPYISGYYKDNMVFDFYLPEQNCVIECQGDYWHGNPIKYNQNNINEIQKRNMQRDERKCQYLIDNSIQFLFIWEHDIKRNLEQVKTQILNLLH